MEPKFSKGYVGPTDEQIDSVNEKNNELMQQPLGVWLMHSKKVEHVFHILDLNTC